MGRIELPQCLLVQPWATERIVTSRDALRAASGGFEGMTWE
jgi:hypothetical protein